MKILVLLLALASVSAAPAAVKVAIIGDQGVRPASVAVLELVKSEGANMLFVTGDLGYSDGTAEQWDQQLTDVLGEAYPVFVVVGNHDCCNVGRYRLGDTAWADYQVVVDARMAKIEGLRCTGVVAVDSACTYRGLFWTTSSFGLPIGVTLDDTPYQHPLEPEKLQYLKDQLQRNATWKFCLWHMNHPKAQVDHHGGIATWEPYDLCRRAGAIILTGHDHNYARTYLMSSFEHRTIASTSTLFVKPGQTIAIVSGLGGYSFDSVSLERVANPWWASTLTRLDPDYNFGALFCTLEVTGRGSCYFKTIDGVIVDEFEIRSAVMVGEPIPSVGVLGLVVLVALLGVIAYRRRGGMMVNARLGRP